MDQPAIKIIARNKKAFFDYEILEKIEAGMVLSGPEVKSIRLGHVNLKGTFIEVSKNLEVFARNIHISPYKNASQGGEYNPTRPRKLLLNKSQIIALKSELDTKGITAVPLSLHLSHNLIKLTIGVCRGKKKHDRRNELKHRALNLEIKKTLSKY